MYSISTQMRNAVHQIINMLCLYALHNFICYVVKNQELLIQVLREDIRRNVFVGTT